MRDRYMAEIVRVIPLTFNDIHQYCETTTIPCYSEPGKEGFTPSRTHHIGINPQYFAGLLPFLRKGGTAVVSGPSASGKLSMLREIAACLNYNLFVQYCSPQMYSELFGQYLINKKGVIFQQSMFVQMLQEPGTIVVLEEYDQLDKDAFEDFILPLIRTGMFSYEVEGKAIEVKMHPENRLVLIRWDKEDTTLKREIKVQDAKEVHGENHE